jgi:hypothetical protein
MIGITRSAALLLLMATALTASIPSPSQCQSPMLPHTAGGWIRTDTVSSYAGKDLFRLVDGGADLFFEYGFVQAAASEYSLSTASASAELYEMKNPAAAYGLFTSFSRGTGTAVTVGQEAVTGEGYCIFWKGLYVGMVTASSADSASTRLLCKLAAELAGKIPQEGPLPPLCTLLREQGIEPRTMVFVRGKLALGNQLPHRWAAPFPPADGVVGSSGSSSYMILEYGSAALADGALRTAALEWQKQQLRTALDVTGKWTIQEDIERIVSLERQGRHILAVSGRKEETEALGLRLRGLLAGS